jgi:hypothetical protein
MMPEKCDHIGVQGLLQEKLHSEWERLDGGGAVLPGSPSRALISLYACAEKGAQIDVPISAHIDIL